MTKHPGHHTLEQSAQHGPAFGPKDMRERIDEISHNDISHNGLAATLASPVSMSNAVPTTHENDQNGSSQNAHSQNGTSQNGAAKHDASDSADKMFQNPFAACNFIVTWDGEDCRELLKAIRIARESQDRFIQDKLIEYILNIPLRNPRPADIPAFVGKPVWAVDKQGRAIVGMPGTETVVDVTSLRQQRV